MSERDNVWGLKTSFLNRGTDVQQGFRPHSVCQHLALLCAWSAMSP